MSQQATYSQYSIQVLGNRYTVLTVTGKFNYVNVRKETNNPYKAGGKTFSTFDAANKHYKSPEMQLELLKIETKLVQPVHTFCQ